MTLNPAQLLATSNAKSIEEIRSFISRQKETYRTPYESQPKDRLRQCVFGGTSNRLDFLPLDRAGNRRFLPVMVCPKDAQVHEYVLWRTRTAPDPTFCKCGRKPWRFTGAGVIP